MKTRRKPFRGLGEKHFRQEEDHLPTLSGRNEPGLSEERNKDKCGCKF